MSAYPLMLDGDTLSAVVVGGGAVAARKVRVLAEAGARVHVVAPEIAEEVRNIANARSSVRITQTAFENEHFGDALLIVVATDDNGTNERIAAEARAHGRLVNVVSKPELGNCVTPAIHRAGGVVVAVTADRVPTAASRIRDRIARVVDDRYASAIQKLSLLRATLLQRGGRDRWRDANDTLVAEDFCDRVEAGAFDVKVAEWH